MGKRLYVGNLSYDTDVSRLTETFTRDGLEVSAVHIVTDRETGRPRGFAFVEMATDDQAKAAIEAMDGVELDGRRLRVSEAEERRPPSGPRPDRPGPQAERARPQREGEPAAWRSGDAPRRRTKKEGGRDKGEQRQQRGGRRRRDEDDDWEGGGRGRPGRWEDEDEW